MSIDRRAFLASLLALPLAGRAALELLDPEPELEARKKAFADWVEEDTGRKMDELNRLMKRAFENDIIESVAHAPPAFLEPASSSGRYFETPQLYRSS